MCACGVYALQSSSSVTILPPMLLEYYFLIIVVSLTTKINIATCTYITNTITMSCFHYPPIMNPAGSTTLPPTPTMPTIPTPTAPPFNCTEFELQLGNAVHSVTNNLTTGTSRFSLSGSVEICLGGSFFSVCDVGWGQEEAQVACNALNYRYRKLISDSNCAKRSTILAQMPV